jgi:hypothetical protein
LKSVYGSVAAENRPQPRSDPLDDRELLWSARFAVEVLPGHEALEPERVNAGPGRILTSDTHLNIDYSNRAETPDDEKMGVRIVRFALPEASLASGYGMRLRLRGWKTLAYIAIGHPEGGSYRHVKAMNPRQDHWFDLDIGFRDIAWGWRNGWERPEDRPVDEVRFYIKGVPGPRAGCDLAAVRLWREAAASGAPHPVAYPVAPAVLYALSEYQRTQFPNYVRLGRAFMDEGRCPLGSNTLLDWDTAADMPEQLFDNGTWQYSWHALHPAVLLLLLAEDASPGSNAAVAPLMSARDFITDWLSRNHERPEANTKYAWYDHGTAERVLALLMLYGAGQRQCFDVRILSRLRQAILRHGQLLASEVFYAGHQRSRYHNHAWFQDLALIVIGLVFPHWRCAERWVDLALERITDQSDRLIVTDGDYAVLAENSIGYHMGIASLLASIGKFALLSGRDTKINAIVSALTRFSDLMRFPCGKRTFGHGDSFRLPNPPAGDPCGREPLKTPVFAVLPSAGYAVAKANHGAYPFMLVFLATSRSETHKHADNLSFALYLDGIEWLIDPSFLSHEYTSPFPAYLRSAAAHNALVLPGAPYSITPGLAVLSGKVDEGGFNFEGVHEAVDGARFERRITGARDALRLEVSDQLSLKGSGTSEAPARGLDPASARLMFHCGEGVEAAPVSGGLCLSHSGTALKLRLALPEGCRVELIRDRRTDPIRGIAGQRFLELAGITTIEIALPPGDIAINWRLWAE